MSEETITIKTEKVKISDLTERERAIYEAGVEDGAETKPSLTLEDLIIFIGLVVSIQLVSEIIKHI